ncbi:MAG: SRPBCC family protein [Desulfobacterales bacterium]|nr:SRPBCC family protein [Desulfobacterales bacterium]
MILGPFSAGKKDYLFFTANMSLENKIDKQVYIDMARIEKCVEINAPPEKIWPLVQPEKMPEWYKPFKRVEWTSKEKYKEGSTFHFVAEFSGMKTESDAEMTSVIANKQGIWRTTSGPYTNIASVVLSPASNGTKATFSMDYELPYSILGKLIDKLRFHKAIEKSFDEGTKRLKEIAEE